MTLLYEDSRFLRHETGQHPERAARIRGIPDRLERDGLVALCQRVEWDLASRERIGRVHSPSYVHEVWAMCKSGGGELDSGDTVVGPGSFDIARLAVGSVCDAVERVCRDEQPNALCLVRPPGHHALTNQGMGFCLFNNVAVAARVAIEELKLSRVLIVDWDVHHGNGTQATFWEDPRVAFLSIHRWPFFPGTGADDETGSGEGLGTTVNLPVASSITRGEYLDLFATRLATLADKFRPELVLLSAGFDSHRLDPIAGLCLETEDFESLTDTVQDIARTHASGRLVSVLEGGYNPEILADCVAVHLRRLVSY